MRSAYYDGGPYRSCCTSSGTLLAFQYLANPSQALVMGAAICSPDSCVAEQGLSGDDNMFQPIVLAISVVMHSV
jgi:hypothetical protein